MPKNLYLTALPLLLSFFAVVLLAQNTPPVGPVVIKAPELFQSRGLNDLSDRAIGLLDYGELSNLITNYGIISDYHVGAPALHWPRAGTPSQQYGFGVNLILVADGQVITSFYDPSAVNTNFKWDAADGSKGTYFNSSPTNVTEDGITPFLASSDLTNTWPVINGTPTWPGYYRENPFNPEQTIPGEFVSDRDVFGVVQDVFDMGLLVKETGYCYGRPYAEDFMFVRFRLFNQSAQDYDSCYAGFQADLRPDFFADDYIQTWAIEPYDQNSSFFYKWDHNGVAETTGGEPFADWVGSVGYVGIGLVDTPQDLGVTSFHFYHDDYTPTNYAYFTAMLSNNPQVALPNISKYFHGSDPAFDDPAWVDSLDSDTALGSKVTFTMGSGPFSLASGDSVEFALVMAIGSNESDLNDNVDMAYYMAKEKAYQGSGPPQTPVVTAVPGDGVVHVYWDNRAESSMDAITNVMDFEGYKVYKSTDQGETWGQPVTNYYGDPIGWAPIAQFDLIDSVTGLDPAYGPNFPNANHWLGDDTGLQHVFTDTNVVNGQEVWYCVTAYDWGIFIPSNPDTTEPSYENAIGASLYDVHVAAATPGTPASNWTTPTISPFVELNNIPAGGTLELLAVDSEKLLDHTYEITFNDSGDTVIIGQNTVVATELTMNLEDLTTGSFYFINNLLDEGFIYKNIPLQGDDQPIVNGFRLNIKQVEGEGVQSLGWTTHLGDSCTFDWWTENRFPNNQSSFPEIVYGLDDWRITITPPTDTIPIQVIGPVNSPPDSIIYANIRVERAIYPEMSNWFDVSDYVELLDMQIDFSLPSVGPYGWNLVPGGPGYNADPTSGSLWPDLLILRDDDNDSLGSEVDLKTQNGPATAIPPSVGDVFTIATKKPFVGGMAYQFSTQPPTLASQAPDLSRIKVVPNPFIVSSGLESNPYESKVMFTHLPVECDIVIYTVAGNRVINLHHQSASGEGFMYWDLRNHEGQNVAYGLYVYVVKTPGGSTHTGKLMVIR